MAQPRKCGCCKNTAGCNHAGNKPRELGSMHPYRSLPAELLPTSQEFKPVWDTGRKVVLCWWLFSLTTGFSHFCLPVSCFPAHQISQVPQKLLCQWFIFFFLQLKTKLKTSTKMHHLLAEGAVMFYPSSPALVFISDHFRTCANSITK